MQAGTRKGEEHRLVRLDEGEKAVMCKPAQVRTHLQ